MGRGVPDPSAMFLVSSGNQAKRMVLLALFCQAMAERHHVRNESNCPHASVPPAHDSLDWNSLLQLWYLLGAGVWRLWVRCRAVVENRKGQGRWEGVRSLLVGTGEEFVSCGLLTKS